MEITVTMGVLLSNIKCQTGVRSPWKKIIWSPRVNTDLMAHDP